MGGSPAASGPHQSFVGGGERQMMDSAMGARSVRCLTMRAFSRDGGCCCGAAVAVVEAVAGAVVAAAVTAAAVVSTAEAVAPPAAEAAVTVAAAHSSGAAWRRPREHAHAGPLMLPQPAEVPRPPSGRAASSPRWLHVAIEWAEALVLPARVLCEVVGWRRARRSPEGAISKLLDTTWSRCPSSSSSRCEAKRLGAAP